MAHEMSVHVTEACITATDLDSVKQEIDRIVEIVIMGDAALDVWSGQVDRAPEPMETLVEAEAVNALANSKNPQTLNTPL